MGCITFIFLVLATASIIAGTAIGWHVLRTAPAAEIDSTTTSAAARESERSAYQYLNLCFVYAALVSWFGAFAEWRGWKSSENRRHLFYGLMFFIAVLSPSSFKLIDDLRFAVQNHMSVPLANPAAPTWSYDEARKMLAGAILNYAGLLVLLFLNHGRFVFRCDLSLFFFLVAVAANVVGVIILWNLKYMSHSETGNAIIRDLVFTDITTPQIFLLLTLSGSIFFEHVDGANASMVFLAGYGMWYLAWGFSIRYIWTTEMGLGFTTLTLESSRVWAGSLLCWCSAWVSILAAQFACNSYQNNNDGLATPSHKNY